MRTLKQIRIDVETKQAEFRKTHSLNMGVIRGAVDTSDLQADILADQAEYNRRSKLDHYYGGRIVKR
jgi:hypothetical protein